jgi:hypothetical protein
VLQGPAEAPNQPWLGAKLDVGGYTKRGFISGGGKDQNQDRSVDGVDAITSALSVMVYACAFNSCGFESCGVSGALLAQADADPSSGLPTMLHGTLNM